MEADLLKRRIFDTADICEKTNRPKFLGFLSLEQAALAKSLLSGLNIHYEFFGGFNGAERLVLGCFPSWAEEHEFPVTAITASFREADRLTHRDVLGTLMGLGLKRETVGDILVESGRAVIFLLKENAAYVLSQVEKIGGVGVTLKEGFVLPLPSSGELKELSVTVASDRIDCVVAALIGVSRARAVEKLNQSLVSVNSQTAEKATHRVKAGDVISVRRGGRFSVVSLDDRTRKNRIVLKYKKYV